MKYVLAGSEEINWGQKETKKWWHHTSMESLPHCKIVLKKAQNLMTSEILESD